MAISQVPGYALLTTLDRQGRDLSFVSTTNTSPNGTGATLLYLDYANWTLGINEPNPYNFGQSLVVTGNILSNSGSHFTTSNLSFDLGNVTNQWRNVYAGSFYGTLQTANQPNITSIGNLTNLTVTGTLSSTGVLYANSFVANGTINAGNNRIIYVGSPVVGTDAATKAYVDAQVVIAANIAANIVPILTPSINGGNLQANAAYLGFTAGTFITDAIDILNSVAENLFTNTFVRTVTFSSNVTAGGAGQTILLTMVPQGNVNQYVINWGDGSGTTTTSSTTSTHTYTTNSGSPYTITVTATNTGGAGPSNSATNSIPNYIIIYGANPSLAFNLYRTNSGGTILSGNNLYAIQGNVIYLQNTSTNTNAATVTWSVSWGDGNIANIANNTSSGGVLGSNLAYTYISNSGSGQWGVNLALLTDNLANPAIIPLYSNVALKVYGNAVSPPAGLNTKTLTYTGSVGNSPYLSASATDNTGGTTLTAGAAVNRATYNQATINTTGNVTSSYTYNANVGSLRAVINGTVRGNVNLATQTTAVVTGNLGVIAFSDYNLLTSAGAATTFASSTYYPGYYYGFEANIVSSGGQLPVGINRVGLNHTTTGATNNVEFVVDNVTTTPTVSTGVTIAGTNGTFRYISGIPYYNTGTPTILIGNVVVGPNWIGQTYLNGNPVTLATGQNQEGTASSLFTGATQPTYATISNSSATMLSGGVPIANTGAASGYTLNPLTISNFQTNVRTVANVLIAVYNVNGYANVYTTANIQVHSAAQSGISEIAISANTSANTNPAVRSTYFLSATTNTPTYVNTTNFLSAGNVYTETSDPGVTGTREATIRLGVLKWAANNYSTGYLPVGPNRSGDGTSNQFFTMAFNRLGISSFNLNIIAPAGVVGLWIAAPGTYIDQTSGLNGWLDATTSYAGSGRPGSNTGVGGNGSNGCGSGALIAANVALNGTYTMTLGNVSLTNATNNVALVRIALASGQTISTLAVS
jgi:hypothetical protein